MSKFCRKCGKELLDDSQFCDGCGTAVNEINSNIQVNNQENYVTNNQPKENNVVYPYSQNTNEVKVDSTKNKETNSVNVLVAFLVILFAGLFFYLAASGELNIFNYEKEQEKIDTTGIDYQQITVDELMKKLEENPAAAKEEYKGKYLEITGKMDVIDSDLKYIGIYAINDFDLTGIHCRVKDKVTKEKIKTLTKGQTIVVRGKITDVGEIAGYYMDIHQIL